MLSLITFSSFSQKVSDMDAGKIKISWELLENNYKNTGTARSRMTLTNSNNVPLSPAWVIYFNAADPKPLDKKTAVFDMELINGDFFKLSPTSSFKTLPPKGSVTMEVLSRNLKDVTDFPKGFYIAFDEQPEKGKAIDYEAKSVINYSAAEKTLAAQIFNKNKSIVKVAPQDLPPVFPSPSGYKKNNSRFTLTKEVKIIADPLFNQEAGYLAEELKTVFGVKPVTGISESKNVILLRKTNLKGAEAYQLQVSNDQIIISASGNAGIFYGIQSLKSLFPAKSWSATQSSISLTGLEIEDAPRFGHRAFMMDIARNFQPKKQVIKILDLLSLYKLNVLHLHFNDDEGWRIEIPGLPELTTVAAQRGHTLTEKDHLIPSYGSGPETNTGSGSGYLTRADYIELLKYATARHITVIPEFETPGHARAAIKAMDARYERLSKEGDQKAAEQYLLRDLRDQSDYRSVQGWSDNVINPALPSVYNFIEKLSTEMISMYNEAGAPLKTIHFGGDEVPAGVWEKSPAVAELLKHDTTVTSVDEIWYYYFAKVNAILKSHQLYLSGWEEIGLRKKEVNGRKSMVLDPRFANENFHTDVWNNLAPNEDLAYQLANAGYKVVLTNVTNMYMDLAYNKSYEEHGQYWGGYVDVDKLFDFIPFNYYKNQKENERGEILKPAYFANKERLTEKGKANIIGLQAPLWSEVITNEKEMEYLLLPKILGLAERAWSADPEWAKEQDEAKSNSLYPQSWSSFLTIIGERELPRLDHYAGGFNYRIPTAGLISAGHKLKANVQFPGFIIRYTTDGTVPTKNSKIFANGMTAVKNISLRVFNQAGRGGRTIKL